MNTKNESEKLKPSIKGIESNQFFFVEENRPTGKPSLRSILWTIVLPGLLADNTKVLVEEHRTDIQEVMAENMQKTLQVAQEFLIKIGDKHLKSVILFILLKSSL